MNYEDWVAQQEKPEPQAPPEPGGFEDWLARQEGGASVRVPDYPTTLNLAPETGRVDYRTMPDERGEAIRDYNAGFDGYVRVPQPTTAQRQVTNFILDDIRAGRPVGETADVERGTIPGQPSFGEMVSGGLGQIGGAIDQTPVLGGIKSVATQAADLAGQGARQVFSGIPRVGGAIILSGEAGNAAYETLTPEEKAAFDTARSGFNKTYDPEAYQRATEKMTSALQKPPSLGEEALVAYETKTPVPLQIGLAFVDPTNDIFALPGKAISWVNNSRRLNTATQAIEAVTDAATAARFAQDVKSAGLSTKQGSRLLDTVNDMIVPETRTAEQIRAQAQQASTLYKNVANTKVGKEADVLTARQRLTDELIAQGVPDKEAIQTAKQYEQSLRTGGQQAYNVKDIFRSPETLFQKLKSVNPFVATPMAMADQMSMRAATVADTIRQIAKTSGQDAGRVASDIATRLMQGADVPELGAVAKGKAATELKALMLDWNPKDIANRFAASMVSNEGANALRASLHYSASRLFPAPALNPVQKLMEGYRSVASKPFMDWNPGYFLRNYYTNVLDGTFKEGIPYVPGFSPKWAEAERARLGIDLSTKATQGIGAGELKASSTRPYTKAGIASPAATQTSLVDKAKGALSKGFLKRGSEAEASASAVYWTHGFKDAWHQLVSSNHIPPEFYQNLRQAGFSDDAIRLIKSGVEQNGANGELWQTFKDTHFKPNQPIETFRAGNPTARSTLRQNNLAIADRAEYAALNANTRAEYNQMMRAIENEYRASIKNTLAREKPNAAFDKTYKKVVDDNARLSPPPQYAPDPKEIARQLASEEPLTAGARARTQAEIDRTLDVANLQEPRPVGTGETVRGALSAEAERPITAEMKQAAKVGAQEPVLTPRTQTTLQSVLDTAGKQGIVTARDNGGAINTHLLNALNEGLAKESPKRFTMQNLAERADEALARLEQRAEVKARAPLAPAKNIKDVTGATPSIKAFTKKEIDDLYERWKPYVEGKPAQPPAPVAAPSAAKEAESEIEQKIAAEQAKGKFSNQTGFTPTQERHLLGELRSVPEKGKKSIPVPGDGTVTVNKEQAGHLEEILKGDLRFVPEQNITRGGVYGQINKTGKTLKPGERVELKNGARGVFEKTDKFGISHFKMDSGETVEMASRNSVRVIPSESKVIKSAKPTIGKLPKDYQGGVGTWAPDAVPAPSPRVVLDEQQRAVLKALDEERRYVTSTWGAKATPLKDARAALDYAEQSVNLQGRLAEAYALASRYGDATRNFILHDYAGGRLNLDTLISYAIPWNYWYTREGWTYAQTMLRQPGILAAYSTYRRALEDINKDLPESYRESIQVGPASMRLYVNLANTLVPFETHARAIRGAQDAESGGVGSMLQGGVFDQFNLYPGMEYVWDAIRGKPSLSAQTGDMGTMTSQARLAKGLSAAAKRALPQLPIPPGGINPEQIPYAAATTAANMAGFPNAKFTANDPYEIGRISDALTEMFQRGEMSQAAYQQAIATRSGEWWNKAENASAVRNLIPDLTSFATGVRARQMPESTPQIEEAKQAYDRMWEKINQIQDQTPDSQKRVNALFAEFERQYPFYAAYSKRYKSEEDRAEFVKDQTRSADFGTYGQAKLQADIQLRDLEQKHQADLAKFPVGYKGADLDKLNADYKQQQNAIYKTIPPYPGEGAPTTLTPPEQKEAQVSSLSKSEPRSRDFKEYAEYQKAHDQWESSIGEKGRDVTLADVREYNRRNDTIRDAAESAWYDQYYNPLQAELKQVRDTYSGKEQKLMERQVLAKYGEPDATKFADYIKQTYGNRWTDAQLKDELAKLKTATADERRKSGMSEGDRLVDSAYTELAKVPPGKSDDFWKIVDKEANAALIARGNKYGIKNVQDLWNNTQDKVTLGEKLPVILAAMEKAAGQLKFNTPSDAILTEWVQAEKDITEYYKIPETDKAARREYWDAHPLLSKYYSSGDKQATTTSTTQRTYSSGGGGGGGGGGGKSYYSKPAGTVSVPKPTGDLWNALKDSLKDDAPFVEAIAGYLMRSGADAELYASNNPRLLAWLRTIDPAYLAQLRAAYLAANKPRIVSDNWHKSYGHTPEFVEARTRVSRY